MNTSFCSCWIWASLVASSLFLVVICSSLVAISLSLVAICSSLVASSLSLVAICSSLVASSLSLVAISVHLFCDFQLAVPESMLKALFVVCVQMTTQHSTTQHSTTHFQISCHHVSISFIPLLLQKFLGYLSNSLLITTAYTIITCCCVSSSILFSITFTSFASLTLTISNLIGPPP